MKHNYKITTILLTIFLLSQLIGIGLLYLTIDKQKSIDSGKTEFKDLALQERPQLEEQTSYIPIIIMVFIGTILLLILIKFKLFIVWKIWYLLAIMTTLTTSFAVIIQPTIAIILAVILGLWKVFKPNIYIHNFTELFIYPAIALLFVPVINLFSITMLLILISIYDAYAVWKSKHMVTLAESQTKAQLFAGLYIPYNSKQGMPGSTSKTHITNPTTHSTSSTTHSSKTTSATTTTTKITPSQHTTTTTQETRTAVLGGGDIAFPLLFTGVMLKLYGLNAALIVPIFTTIALALLFFYGKPNRYYPAMLFISAGCAVSYGVIYLLHFI